MRHTLAALTICSLTLVGCGSNPRVIDDTELLTTYKLDVQDVERFAEELAVELINADVLGQEGKPSIIVVERFVNNTSQTNLDRDRVLGRVLIALNRSNVARAYMAGTSLGEGESALATAEAAERGVNERKYDYAVITKLYEDRASVGNTKQASYIIQMSVTNLNTGVVDWMDERRISKQGERKATGF
jgi:PBP1b-binding outer membrane lipoprotein LpoB